MGRKLKRVPGVTEESSLGPARVGNRNREPSRGSCPLVKSTERRYWLVEVLEHHPADNEVVLIRRWRCRLKGTGVDIEALSSGVISRELGRLDTRDIPTLLRHLLKKVTGSASDFQQSPRLHIRNDLIIKLYMLAKYPSERSAEVGASRATSRSSDMEWSVVGRVMAADSGGFRPWVGAAKAASGALYYVPFTR